MSRFDSTVRARPAVCPPGSGVLMLGRFVQVQCCVDDIMTRILWHVREAHLRLVHVRIVLETLRHHKLYAKASKCQFGPASSAMRSPIGRPPGPGPEGHGCGRRRRGVGNTDVVHGRFVGLANYYRKFVFRFSAIMIAAPLRPSAAPGRSWRGARPSSRASTRSERRCRRLRCCACGTRRGRRACSPTPRTWPCRPSWSSPTTRARSIPSPSTRSLELTQPERSYPPHLLVLLAVVHALKALLPYLLDKPFEPHTDDASLQWLQQQRQVSEGALAH